MSAVFVVCNLLFVAEKVLFAYGLTGFAAVGVIVNGFFVAEKILFLPALAGFYAIVVVMNGFFVAEKVLFRAGFAGFYAVYVIMNNALFPKPKRPSFDPAFSYLVAVIVVVNNLFIAENIGYLLAFHIFSSLFYAIVLPAKPIC